MHPRKGCPIWSVSSQVVRKEHDLRNPFTGWPKAKQIKDHAKRVEEILMAPCSG